MNSTEWFSLRVGGSILPCRRFYPVGIYILIISAKTSNPGSVAAQFTLHQAAAGLILRKDSVSGAWMRSAARLRQGWRKGQVGILGAVLALSPRERMLSLKALSLQRRNKVLNLTFANMRHMVYYHSVESTLLSENTPASFKLFYISEILNAPISVALVH